MKPISFSAQEEIFSNQYLRLYSIRANFGTYEKEYFVTEKGTRVGVLLLREDSILLVRQYRLLINDMSWEIPGGGVMQGESIEETAIRECREEAGIVCHSVTPLFNYPLGIDVTDSHVYLFQSSDFSNNGIIRNTETDARKWVPYDECIHLVFSGEIKDSMTIMALLVYSQALVSK